MLASRFTINEVLAASVLLIASMAAMPESGRSVLDAHYAGWKPAHVAAQIEHWFDEYGFRNRPQLILADFDGDGKQDVAALILTRDGRELLVCLLERQGRFELQTLANDKPDAFTYLLLYAKGSKDMDFTTLKPFRHRTDAIGLMYFDRTPYTFIWRNGKFQRMLAPSDEEAAGNPQQ